MTLIEEIVVSALMISGAACGLLAAVGLLRMPDLYTRLQASSKAATLGAILIMLAAALFFHGGSPAVRALLVILFLGLTTPVGAHRIARAGYLRGERMQDPGALDEWAEHRERS